MKLGELCEVMNDAMIVKVPKKDFADRDPWAGSNTSFQQKMQKFKDFVGWDVVGISRDEVDSSFIAVEIVKPEEEE